jgi:hypothetical protein
MQIWLKRVARDIDYLIQQGHIFSEIQNYNVPQLKTFVSLANRRQKMEMHERFSSRLVAAHGNKEQVKDYYNNFKVEDS